MFLWVGMNIQANAYNTNAFIALQHTMNREALDKLPAHQVHLHMYIKG